MKKLLLFMFMLALGGCSDNAPTTAQMSAKESLKLQLNWFHDPTFAGEYRAKELLGDELVMIEGGVNINPIQKLKSGLTDIAVVGIDIALKAIESDVAQSGKTDLRIVYVDFQRNPVGWIIHPKTAEKYSMPDVHGIARNDWLFNQFQSGNIRPGDKRGTETTAIWTTWRSVRRLESVNVIAVGFDPTIVLDAPDLAYPVYMNEEPFKLSERIGTPVIVFDPADDGVELYGNVLITNTQTLERREKDIEEFLSVLSQAWNDVKNDREATLTLVKQYYKDVTDDVIRAQIGKTAEFVFFKTRDPGVIDLANDGRLQDTIAALQSAGTLQDSAVSDVFVKYVIPFQPVTP